MNGRALVADDDPETLALVAMALEHLGMDVTCADDGDELLQKLAGAGAEPFALVVTDLAMPWMTGLHVAHSARAAGLETPVILITASKVGAEVIEGLGHHARLLRKPFGSRRLVGVVKDLLS